MPHTSAHLYNETFVSLNLSQITQRYILMFCAKHDEI